MQNECDDRLDTHRAKRGWELLKPHCGRRRWTSSACATMRSLPRLASYLMLVSFPPAAFLLPLSLPPSLILLPSFSSPYPLLLPSLSPPPPLILLIILSVAGFLLAFASLPPHAWFTSRCRSLMALWLVPHEELTRRCHLCCYPPCVATLIPGNPLLS